ncbi:MAG: hypothetical protein KatS3mg039_0581 [Candidatus Kapaibacterium sp.]|nr:MAG: hypothetical protein KatS3mg039_0581 [Candidatus Kapabacteria bacterium]
MWSWFAKLWITLCAPLTIMAQGFDWVPTYMLPFRIPTVYGITGVQLDAVTLHDTRAVTQGTLVCASYGDGTGVQGKFTVGGEWWAQADVSLALLLNVGWLRTTHYASGTVAPLVTGEMLRTEYVLSTSRLLVSVQVAAKKRLLLRYGWLRAGIELGTYLAPSVEQRERVLEPSWYMFATTPPSQQVVIASGTDNRTNLHGSVVLSIGYDLSVRNGLYVLPSVEAALPLTLTAGDFRLWRIGISIPIAFSLP